jgi:hypothetical protein
MISRCILAVFVIVSLSVYLPAAAQQETDSKVTTSEKPESSVPAEVIKRGNKIGNKSPTVSLEEIFKNPGKYENKKIIIVGTVDAVCQKKGCWMELVPAAGEQGVRVRFKDYGFFVPKDAKGYKVRAEGKIKLVTLTKTDADHYEEEGARLVRSPDGTVSEIGFVAYGVELYK